MDINDLHKITEVARRRLLQLHCDARIGHLGGSLSSLEAMMALFHELMMKNDCFILSKGHIASLLYVALWSKGLLDEEVLRTFAHEGTVLPAHPSGKGIPGLLFPSGSLGHGPSLAAGLALAAHLKNRDHQIWCLCSDGEWQEGSCWEALIFAVHHRLDNLTLLVDQNGWQAFGTTEDVASINDLTPRFSVFGAYATKVNGHDQKAVIEAARDRRAGLPRVIVLETIKGRGTSLENTLASHYLPLEKTEFETLMMFKEADA